MKIGVSYIFPPNKNINDVFIIASHTAVGFTAVCLDGYTDRKFSDREGGSVCYKNNLIPKVCYILGMNLEVSSWP